MNNLINIHNEQLKLYNISPSYEITIENVKKILKENPHLIQINKEIKKLPLFSFSLIKRIDYVVDALNIEGGFINKFKQIKKLLTDPKINLKNKRVLIIVRAPMAKQKKSDDKSCKKLVKEHSNIKIIYIHTSYTIGKKSIRLIETCRTSKYCTPQEVVSGLSIKGERLCVTPIITSPNKIQTIRPVHSICEIDDLMVFYFALKYNAIIISGNEDYTQIIDEKKIKSIKYFLNIPITYYYLTHKKDFYIAPFKWMNSFLKINKRITPEKSIILKQN